MIKFFRFSLLISMVVFTLGCQSTHSPDTLPGSEKPIQEFRIEPSWVQEGLIYELFVRDFSAEGTFQAIIPRLPELKKLGVKTIWLMPIHPIGEKERKGSLGSPYSIQDYYAVDPAYGTLGDFSALVRAIHELDMYVILDLVINHTAWDHPWTSSHPHWYTRTAAGDLRPPIPDWADVVQLDLTNTELRRELMEVMAFWIRNFDIDGYRVDVADLIPKDFWATAIPWIQDIKPSFFLAESGDSSLGNTGFTLIYGWESYHRLKSIAQGGQANRLAQSAEYELRRSDNVGYLRFITNHDETAWDAPPVVLFGGLDGAKAYSIAQLFTPGIPLIYNGQEIGNDQSWAFFEKWNYDWTRNPETLEFYQSLGQVWQNSPALKYGDIIPVELNNREQVVAYLRRSHEETVLVFANMRNTIQEFWLPDELSGRWYDLFQQKPVWLEGRISLEPYQFMVVRFP